MARAIKSSISVEHISKTFALRHNRVDSLKGKVVGLFKRRWRQRIEQFEALHDVSFTVSHGESVALLGHNGSGKSTLLQIITRILRPTSGRVRVQGRIAPLIELGVGFNPELTGEENIYLNASLFGFSNRRTAALYQEIVQFSELGDFIDTPVKNYSSGMYMRLGFSVAAHLNPDILLADEVLAVGDQAFQDKCHNRIRELQRNGLILVLVTHSQAQAAQFCTRYIRLDHGRVIDQGPTSALAADQGMTAHPARH
ncbi:MAG: ABC transporter ATP-binding protein [Acidiferrobacteraceae bacterium]